MKKTELMALLIFTLVSPFCMAETLVTGKAAKLEALTPIMEQAKIHCQKRHGNDVVIVAAKIKSMTFVFHGPDGPDAGGNIHCFTKKRKSSIQRTAGHN